MGWEKELIERVRVACRDEPRPEHFTNYGHCCECAEHDATLRAATPEMIGLKELGNPGWDPICFITPVGFRYYLPALARLALGRGEAYYLGQFLFHLRSGRVAELTAEQRAAVLALLEYVDATMRDELDGSLDREALDEVMLALLE
jgi:hypothetical protein